MSGPRLGALREDLATRKTQAFRVIRNDEVVCGRYVPGVAADTERGTALLAKAIVGGLSLAVAVTAGLSARRSGEPIHRGTGKRSAEPSPAGDFFPPRLG
jgi:hypothetical protein